ncbi:MAG: hypothetical protein WCK93_09015 [Nitrosomonadales bacterium]
MLSEWLTYLAADCSDFSRKSGYLRESIGTRSRYRRCKNAWQSHLENSRSALLESINACSSHRTALVLGSGVLLDIPLAELAARFENVWLVDLVHLPEVRRAVRRYANVRCIEHDVTGFREQSATLLESRLDLPDPVQFLDELRIDWVASVNLLSQLPLLPQDWLRAHFPSIDEQKLEAWGDRIMQQHLDYLAAFSVPVCLLTDYVQTSYEKSGEILSVVDFSTRVRFAGTLLKTWRWDVAPPGEISGGTGRFHLVASIAIS